PTCSTLQVKYPKRNPRRDFICKMCLTHLHWVGLQRHYGSAVIDAVIDGRGEGRPVTDACSPAGTPMPVNNHESDIWGLLEIWFDLLLIGSNYEEGSDRNSLAGPECAIREARADG